MAFEKVGATAESQSQGNVARWLLRDAPPPSAAKISHRGMLGLPFLAQAQANRDLLTLAIRGQAQDSAMLQAQALANRDAAAAQLHAMRALGDANGHAAISDELQCWHSDAHENATTASHVLRELVEDNDDVTARHTSNESARCEGRTLPEVPYVPVLLECAYAWAVVLEVDISATPAKGADEDATQDTTAQAMLASECDSRANVPYVPELLNTIAIPAYTTDAHPPL